MNKLSNAIFVSDFDKFSDVTVNGSAPSTVITTDSTPSAFNRFVAAVATPVPANASTEFIPNPSSSTVTVIVFPSFATSNFVFAATPAIVLYASFTKLLTFTGSLAFV